MASVTFPIGLGGDGSTVTDDSNATTGLGNGGHRARFVPALNQTVAMANTAVNSASTATTQAASATASASSASTSATNANNSFLSIDTKYLGEKTGDPTVDNQGGALATGAEYWNSSTSTMRVYNGTSWQNSSALTDFASNTFRISDNTDSTKKVAFNTSGITTGTVRTLTIPNVNGTVITSGDTGTVTATLLANTAVTGGSYGSATQVGTFTVDAKGRLTAASNTSIQIAESQVTNLTTDLAAKAPLASPTFTGTVTAPTITTTGATGLTLSNATSNLISFNTAGGGAPTFTTRSAGTKLLLFPELAAASTDYAIGIQAGSMWFGVPDTTRSFLWYGGTTLAATLTGAGELTLTGPTSLTLSNATSNLISFNTNGIGAPTYTTRSAGTKILLYPSIASNLVDGAIGVESGYIWNSVGYSTSGFKWYGGTTVAATLAGTGDLTTTGTVSGSSATGFRNKIINGDFQIWQGGTSFTNPTSNSTAYCADQWLYYRSGYVAGVSATQQQTQTESKGIRIQRTVGDTNTNFISINNALETQESLKYAGKALSLSIKAKAGANFSSTANALIFEIVYGFGTDQNIATGLTGFGSIGTSVVTLSTSLAKFSTTGTVPSNATQIGIRCYYNPTGTAGANDWFEITDVQLEEGRVATPFERRPYGLELSLCQRYYEKSYDIATAVPTNASFPGALFIAASASIANGSQYGSVKFAVPKRSAPTIVTYGYVSSTVSAATAWGATSDLAANSAVTEASGNSSFVIYNNSGGSISPLAGGFILHWTASARL